MVCLGRFGADHIGLQLGVPDVLGLPVEVVIPQRLLQRILVQRLGKLALKQMMTSLAVTDAIGQQLALLF